MKSAWDLLRDKGNAVWSTTPDATVFSALEMMAEKNVGALMVMENGRLAGMFSERDYARKVILHNRHSRETRVSEIMNPDVVTVTPDHDLEACMEIITERRVRHLPVVEDGRVIGIVSIGDIVKGVIEHKEFVIQQLEKYIRGHHR